MVCCDCVLMGVVLVRLVVQCCVLWIVLVINVLIFVGEFGVGWWVDLMVLQGDLLDSFGDVLVYVLSLVVIGQLLWVCFGVVLVKGMVQMVFVLFVLVEVVCKLVVGVILLFVVMVVVVGVVLIVNFSCLFLFMCFCVDDINMCLVWLCFCNDVIGNVGVLFMMLLIVVLGWGWFDFVFGVLLVILFGYIVWDVLCSVWFIF